MSHCFTALSARVLILLNLNSYLSPEESAELTDVANNHVHPFSDLSDDLQQGSVTVSTSDTSNWDWVGQSTLLPAWTKA